jgi:hypothetical protein
MAVNQSHVLKRGQKVTLLCPFFVSVAIFGYLVKLRGILWSGLQGKRGDGALCKCAANEYHFQARSYFQKDHSHLTTNIPYHIAAQNLVGGGP